MGRGRHQDPVMLRGTLLALTNLGGGGLPPPQVSQLPPQKEVASPTELTSQLRAKGFSGTQKGFVLRRTQK